MATISLTNASGARVELSSLGAAIESIVVPDAGGRMADVVVAAGGSAGKTIGRYANRIARGTFSLDGTVYRLATNEGPNTLHGGPLGFSKREWATAGTRTDGRRTVGAEFRLHSAGGDQGFPGALDCNVTYAWSDECALRIDYTATTDAPTVLNLTNHVYFNLAAGTDGSIAQQQLQIAASAYLPVDAELLPTGAIAAVEGTPFDFRTARAIGSEKYDCALVLDAGGGELRPVARVTDAGTGRSLEVRTTEPSLQLYTGKPGALALEAEHFPDAPNRPGFPSTVLRPGRTFTSTTIYAFS